MSASNRIILIKKIKKPRLKEVACDRAKGAN